MGSLFFSGMSEISASVVSSNARDAGSVLQRGASHRGRVNDASREHVGLLALIVWALPNRSSTAHGGPSMCLITVSVGEGARVGRAFAALQLSLRHQLRVLERQAGRPRPWIDG